MKSIDKEENMNMLDWILLILGIIFFISMCAYFIIIEMISSVFKKQGFVGSKEDLYNVAFKEFDFDYTITSGTDNNENQENLISDAIKHIDTEYNPTIKKVDYYS